MFFGHSASVDERSRRRLIRGNDGRSKMVRASACPARAGECLAKRDSRTIFTDRAAAPRAHHVRPHPETAFRAQASELVADLTQQVLPRFYIYVSLNSLRLRSI